MKTLIFTLWLAAAFITGCAHYVWVDLTDCPEHVEHYGKCRERK